MNSTNEIALAEVLLGNSIAEMRDYGLSDLCITAALSNLTGEGWRRLIPNGEARRRVAAEAAMISISK